MNCTEKTENQLMNYINQRLRGKYSPSSYDLATCNCNNFSDDLLQYLVNKTLPSYMTAAARSNKDGWMAWFGSKFTSMGSGSSQGSSQGSSNGSSRGSSHGSQSKNNKIDVHVHLPGSK